MALWKRKNYGRNYIKNDKGEIGVAEYKEAKGELNTRNSYLMFVALVVERLGFFPEKRTQLVDELIFED